MKNMYEFREYGEFTSAEWRVDWSDAEPELRTEHAESVCWGYICTFLFVDPVDGLELKLNHWSCGCQCVVQAEGVLPWRCLVQEELMDLSHTHTHTYQTMSTPTLLHLN